MLQRIILLLGAVVIAGMVLFPPWRTSPGGKYVGFHFLPTYSYSQQLGDVIVNHEIYLAQLLVQILAVTLITSLAYLASRKKH